MRLRKAERRHATFRGPKSRFGRSACCRRWRNGVKGGKWYALMDKVFAPETLATAWTKVRANKGAAGVGGQSIEQFEARVDTHLAEWSAALREGSYQPQAVKR